jgi:hypothetical protein
MPEFVVCAGVLLAAVLVGGVFVVRDRRAFRERFPPISDAEFLALCPPGVSPGVSPEVALKVRRIVADHFAIEYERVHPSMSFIEDLGAD